MSDTTTPPERPQFNTLIGDLRALVRDHEQGAFQKAEAARRNATMVMQRASEMFAKGKITAHDLAHLHAVRLRLDLMLTEGERG